MKTLLLTLLISLMMVSGEGNICSTEGAFEGGFYDIEGTEYYQFKSYDDEVWWALTAEELGFVPKANETYILTYDNNGTTDCTECPKDLECECEVYDDIYLGIREGN